MSIDALAAALADRYTLGRELGIGGMATVYLAHDVRHDRDVAIKVMREELGAALGGTRFLAEITTTAKLQHPHILPLLDSGTAAGRLYYVMPYIRGETLRARLRRETQLPVADAVRIAGEVADALGAAHAMGIVHRDIKPENILLQGDHAVVADFGIALAVQQASGARLTQTGISLGTPEYMSPEQAMGERALDARTDIYALGAVTYEMLSGEPPFTGKTGQAIVARVMTERPESLLVTRDTVPVGIDAAVQRALAKLPADRFPTVQAFGGALVGGLAANAAPPATPGGTRSPRRAARRWQVATAMLGLAAVGAVVAAVVRRPAHTSHILVQRQLTFEGNVLGAAISPDGLWLAYLLDDCALRDAEACTYTLMVREIDGSQAVRIATWPFISGDLRWSGDGRTLVFRGTNQGDKVAIYLSDRLGGTPRRLPVSPTAMTVSQDGASLIATTGPASQPWLRHFDIATLAQHDSTRLPPNLTVQNLVASPRDGRLAALASVGGHSVQLLLLTQAGVLLDTISVPSRTTLRWDSAGTALLYFDDGEGGGVGDDLHRLGLGARGFDHDGPSTLLGQLTSGGLGRFDVSRTGRLIFLIGPANAHLMVAPLSKAAGPWRTVAAPTGYMGVADFTPDGQHLIGSFGDNLGGNFYIYPLGPGAPRAVTSYRSWATSGGRWADNPDYSPDGTHLVFDRGNGVGADVVFTDTSGGHDRVISPNAGSQGEWVPRWLGNDRAVVFRDGAFVVVDTTGAPRDSLSVPDSLALLAGVYSNRMHVAEQAMYYTSGRAGAIIAADFRTHRLRRVGHADELLLPLGWGVDGTFFATGSRGRRSTIYRLDPRTGAYLKFSDVPLDMGYLSLDPSGTTLLGQQAEARRDVWLAEAVSP